ncbi:MAG: heterodisulfide reductase-related iron-sulfur binding cluster [Clostridia bacterium]|nr:heterodisulfide reductase-related iron-sulfur binding cluster [Clostridia bacterium]
MATRQIFWNITGYWLIYPMLTVALAFFCYGFYRRFTLWKLGKSEKSQLQIWAGIKDVIIFGFGHKRIIKDLLPGIMHLLIFWGFVLLTFATTVIALQADLGIPLFQGKLYLFIKLTANLFGLFALIGISLAAFRRYVIRPKGLDNKPDDALTLLLIFLILLSGFLIEGVRMAVLPDPWASWGFVGQWLASIFQLTFNEVQLILVHSLLWWIHLILALVFIGHLPYSKLLHVFLGPVNLFLRRRNPVGVPEKIDFEDESLETFGKSKLEEFSWKILFNTDVCIRCGRCQDNCPANLSGKHISPKAVIQDMRTIMTEKKTGRTLIGEIIPEEDLWSCTTCRSCEEQCPMFIEHVDKTIEMRRHLVLMESSFPPEAKQSFKNMEVNGNPWGLSSLTRGTFLQGLGVKTLQENPAAEVLYWPGCAGSLDARNQKVSAALVKLMQEAGVNFAILGNEEKCCGDSARKLGNEYLFYSLATENIEAIKDYGIRKIVTQCPHCFNMLKNEYPQFGGDFEVVHHTEFLLDLLNQGILSISHGEGKKVSYHDPCYLGRYNQIYEPPRKLIQAAGLEIMELPRNREKSFCCGAGGGRMWLEENEGQRINVMRTDQVIAITPDLVCTACPFCLTMINDGVNAREASEKIKVKDIAEILAENEGAG